ncbi:TetR family transcriptional regulator [Lysobacter korlensis]|uniref:TetR family transcriptional regulator n=1 Tax=Lysobacter korlensis TaxID=553636 RepID=A0ABV6S3E3_9GAMM
MRSDTEDFTTRARIRDAAVLLFGQRGFAGTSVRTVAEAAAVSPGLVIHHFGSKDGLRAECDRFVVDSFLGQKSELSGAEAAAAIQGWLSDLDAFRPRIDYLARMLTDTSPAADSLFDALLAGTAGMLEEQVAAGIMREPIDPQVTAAYLTVYGIVPLLLRRQLGRALGEDDLTPELIRRSTLPILDLYTHGLYADDRILTAAREALDRTSGPRSDKGQNDPNQDPDPPVRAAS